MTIRQWFCGKFGHDWVKDRCIAIVYEQERDQSREAVIEFDVCTKCGLESDYEEATHDQSGL